MAWEKVGEDKKSPEEILEEMEQRRLASVKKNIDNLPSDVLEDFIVDIKSELETRDPEASDKYDLLDISEIIDKIEEKSKNWGKFSGIDTGFTAINEAIGGLKEAEITLIAGESNNGKSAFVSNIVANIAMKHKVLYFTLEMLPESVGSRLKHMVGDDYKKLQIKFQKDFKLDYRGLEPLFKKGVEEGCEVAVLDYLQYMGVGMDTKEVAKMSRIMSSLAKTYKIPFLIVCSLRKGDGTRDWRSITTEDIMGTASIGYDADNILLISRKDDSNTYDPDGMWVRHLKSRDMKVNYKYEFIRFEWDKTKITTDELHLKYINLRNSDSYSGDGKYKDWAVNQPKPVIKQIETAQAAEVIKTDEQIDLSAINKIFPGAIELK